VQNEFIELVADNLAVTIINSCKSEMLTI